MESFCVLVYGVFAVSTLESCAEVGAGVWGTAVLKMVAGCLSSIFCFFPRCKMGLDGVRCCSASVRSAAALVTVSTGDRLGKLFWDENRSVVSDTHSNDILGM